MKKQNFSLSNKSGIFEVPEGTKSFTTVIVEKEQELDIVKLIATDGTKVPFWTLKPNERWALVEDLSPYRHDPLSEGDKTKVLAFVNSFATEGDNGEVLTPTTPQPIQIKFTKTKKVLLKGTKKNWWWQGFTAQVVG